MKIISLACSAFAFAAMASVAQAEPTTMKQPEPMRLAAPEMDNITAGSVTVTTYASGTGTESIYSRAADFSITPSDETSITVDCCGADTTYTNVVVIPRDPIIYQIN
ncbi:hypothetical protein SAMN05216386_0994 [Nitrosospira briensis]|uniref:Uncharacterized protein n=1 Tax=Nitrosospira briensis TaxID=35799 RepID=A0A1I4Z3I0_9PROT|nr:hypothetical protein [Nitrosospira briensis]SFN44430.1 hypothetical protein SAMN05216386_0994 [Nitrosospira briensis]